MTDQTEPERASSTVTAKETFESAHRDTTEAALLRTTQTKECEVVYVLVWFPSTP